MADTPTTPTVPVTPKPPVASTVQGVSASPPPAPAAAPVKASSVQVGGDHYKNCHLQPFQYAMDNSLNYLQSNAVKYVTRYKDKGGVEDLKKAIHTIQLLIEWETANDAKGNA